MNQFESKDLDLIRDLISNRKEGLEENYYTTISGQKTLPKQQVIIQAQINQCKRIIDVVDAQAGNPTSGKILGDDLDPTKHNPFIHLDVDGNEHKNSPLENHLNTMAHIITNLSKKQK